ncbi:hypothetical protein BgAZ_109060 [Babesia gibsoni]|uniref:ADP-ribosylation factor n=1 Tax=Babesia gibsoni TaxID=33632 RepID=A0AAD8USK3_BABGI|nr:hypothetical protein BgAZ_109060 [Babesia gibsoni]
MGGKFSCLKRTPLRVSRSPVFQTRLFGLEGSGKRSIIAFLKHGVVAYNNVYDEANSNMHWITHNKVRMLFWVSVNAVDKDALTESTGVRALIYVVDGSSPESIAQSRDHLAQQLENVNDTPHLLIFLNKCDKPSFAFLEEAHYALGLDNITDRHVRIYSTSAITGEGIREGIEWLCSKFYVNRGSYIPRKGGSRL